MSRFAVFSVAAEMSKYGEFGRLLRWTRRRMRPERIRMIRRIAQQTVAESFMGSVLFEPG